jgi:pyruvate dehydrogenase E2 component (dihydrolipoamide acetyltransferase)
MPVAIIMPKFEMSQETGLMVAWYKEEGSQVEKGEPIFSVETDKVTMDVESPADGILAGITAQAGDEVPVTTVIAYLLKPGESLPEVSDKIESTPASDEQIVKEESVVQLTSEQPQVKKDSAAESEPTPTATPVAQRMAAAAGLALSTIRGSGPNQTITKADVQAALVGAGAKEPDVTEQKVNGAREKVRATPAAKRAAREQAVNLRQVQGSGPRGRVQEGDVVEFLSLEPEDLEGRQAVAPGLSDEVEIITLSGMRKKIADRMTASYQSAPHITFTTRVDVSALQSLRERLNQKAQQNQQANISMTALIVKFVAWALMRHPKLNCVLRGDEIHRNKSVNVGVAVALPDGLIVPVIKHAEGKNVAQIAAEIQDLAQRARKGGLTPENVSDGTFTVSNLGPFGIEQFTAILNSGQAGILAVGAVQPEVVPVENEVAIRPILRMTLSADHRTVDGAVAAQFLAELREVLEDPALMIY